MWHLLVGGAAWQKIENVTGCGQSFRSLLFVTMMRSS